MPEVEHYDAVVLGSGEAGKFMSWHLSSTGKRVANIERKYIGGACPNVACLPSKNIVHSAKVINYLRQAGEFGISLGNWQVSMPAVRARKRRMVDDLQQIHLGNYKKSGAEIVRGSGRFIDQKTFEVSLLEGGTRILRGDQIFLNTGTRATIGATPGLAESAPLTHVEALELDTVPEHLLILGGGYVGLEFAQAMRRFGSRVTLIERNDRLLHREDPDVCEAMHQLCDSEQITVATGINVTRAEGTSGDHVRLHTLKGSDEQILEGSHLLVATGRTPNTENLNLDVAGVALTDRGYFKVNDRLETTAPGVWAMGDCAGTPLFTHMSFDDFRTVRDNLAGENRTTTGRLVPSCMFTDPELAHVGLTETAAKRQNIPYRLAKIPMAAVLRTRTLYETTGFLKALVSKTDDRILGFTGFGIGAGELMSTVQLAMTTGLPYTALRDLIVAHPTLSEGLVSLFSAIPAA
jgi:pyruvate/2-oxoglutarate dehydrogenase complex dihydrolipoamide dehydrogenase (E3) component